ncbi:angiopoietin-related protein 4-like isoform X2 [Chrysemys picta bellii]|uniref:angiopoietin-related protein 4-like isoform X2 n=1 Tax=Chrysemys picta bellii TaxID=8478 RepID=UPI0032B18FDF
MGFQSSSLVLLSALSMMALLCVAPVQGNGAQAHKKVERGFPKDCSNIPRDSPSGIHVIQPAGSPPRVVWCDMDTEGKGWTIVQRNSHNTDITWKESWSTYKYGFGNVQQDYWLGNEYLSLLTRHTESCFSKHSRNQQQGLASLLSAPSLFSQLLAQKLSMLLPRSHHAHRLCSAFLLCLRVLAALPGLSLSHTHQLRTILGGILCPPGASFWAHAIMACSTRGPLTCCFQLS